MHNDITKLRGERGITQVDLARALRVSRQTISAIENGRYNPSLDLAFVIADFFGRPIEQIFFPSRQEQP